MDNKNTTQPEGSSVPSPLPSAQIDRATMGEILREILEKIPTFRAVPMSSTLTDTPTMSSPPTTSSTTPSDGSSHSGGGKH